MAENVVLGSFATLQNSSIISTLNSNNTIIQNAFADCVSLTGVSPNAMQANLDMNNFQILNLPAPATINSPARLVDIATTLNATVNQNLSRLNFTLKAVNFNQTNHDNALAISLPAGFSRYRVASIIVSNASHTLTTATLGVFTSTGGGGLAVAADQALTVTTSGGNAENTAQSLTLTNQNTRAYNSTTLQVRIGTAEGAAATADVVITVDILT